MLTRQLHRLLGELKKQYRPGIIARNTLHGTIWHTTRLSSQILSILVVAHLLGPAGYGTLTGIGGTALILGSLSGLGSSTLLLQHSTRFPDRFNHYWSASLRITFQSASVLIPCHIGLALWLLPPQSIAAVAAISVAELMLYPLVTLCSSAFHARERLGWATAMGASMAIFRLVGALTFWLLDNRSIEQYCLLHLATSAIATSCAMVITRGMLGPKRLKARYTKAELRKGLEFSLSNMSGLGYEETDKLIALKLTSASETGAYTIAYRIARALALPVYTLLQAAQPRLLSSLYTASPEQFNRLVRLLLIAILLYIPVAIVALLITAHLLILLGPAFALTKPALYMLMPLIPLFSLRLLASTLLVCAGRPDLKARHELTATLLLASSCMLLIPLQGIPGVICSVLLAETCLLALTGHSAWRVAHHLRTPFIGRK